VDTFRFEDFWWIVRRYMMGIIGQVYDQWGLTGRVRRFVGSGISINMWFVV
jgi:hypothetical protein